MCDSFSTPNAHKRDRFGLPFLPQPFCPSAHERRQHTRDRLTNQSSTTAACLRTGLVIDSMKIVGKKLNVGSEVSLPSRTHCRRVAAAFNDELRSSHCAGHLNSAAKLVSCSMVHPSMPTANANQRCNCHDDDDSCKHRPADDSHGHQPCRTCQQQEAFPTDPCEQPDECHDCSDGLEPVVSQNSAAMTYSNARIDQNRLLKLLRRFDTIRQRARAARELCLLRFEQRQKQRLGLLDLTDADYLQQNEALDNDNNSPALDNDGSATAMATWNDTGVQRGGRVDVKLRDVIDVCGPARASNVVTTWPPVLDEESVSIEPTDVVISRLMSQFDNIRLDGIAARLDNQKRFENKRKQRKYKL